MSQRIEAGVLLVVLLLTGVAAWWLTQRPGPASDVASLRELPPEVADWRAIDIPIEQDVADMLRADLNVQRAYVHPQGYVVYVYVGYYGTTRGGTPEHTPEMCYPAQGWAILARDSVAIAGAEGLAAREFVVEKDGDRRLVHFWYRTALETGIQSTAALRWTHFWARLRAGRGDGALVRLDTPIEGDDVDAARLKLLPMDRAIESALKDVWPVEQAAEAI
ncbi:MAG: EpsI family protein [Myxococcota bacterium]